MSRRSVLAGAALFALLGVVITTFGGDRAPSTASGLTRSTPAKNVAPTATTTAPAGAVGAAPKVAAPTTTSSTPTSTVTRAAGVTMGSTKLSGGGTRVADAQATSGSATVVPTGGAYTTASVAPGTYMMSARVRSAGERMALIANGAQTGTAAVVGAWRVVSATAYLSGNVTWGVKPIGGVNGGPDQPLYLDWVSLQPASPAYTTIGNKILDTSGQATTPRGVNRNGLELMPGGYWMSDNDFYAMYLWGATIVRLELGQGFWLSSNCDYDPNYATRVDDAVKSITSRGMIAMLNLHTTHVGQSCGIIAQPPMADDYSIRFWNEVAARYKNNPLVAFDLYNEPFVPDATWHDGGTVTTQGCGTCPVYTYHAVGMQQMYDTVRATGATNLVFVSGSQNWAYDISVALRRPVDGYGIVYASHIYANHGNPLQTDISAVLPPVASQYPVMITEFGTQDGTGTYNAAVIDYAESHGLGWAAYAWNDASPSAWALLASFYTYQPSAAGAPVRAALWKAKGWTSFGGK